MKEIEESKILKNQCKYRIIKWKWMKIRFEELFLKLFLFLRKIRVTVNIKTAAIKCNDFN